MKRIASIDIFRALTMLMMLFVNDFAGMGGLPHWLHHAATEEDMLGFSDLVFPAFLFCVGLSIPFAVGNRYRKGADTLQVLGHIVGRTLALVVMGLFTMNLRGVEGGLSRQWLTLLAVAGFFLVWNVYPRRNDGRYPVWVRILQGVGVALLVGMVIYKDLHGMPFRHGWWGILGLIGWAYFPCALGYVVLRGDFNKLGVFTLLMLLLCLLNASPAIPPEWSSRAMILGFWPGGWTHPLICSAGMYTASLMIRYAEQPRRMMTSLALMAAGCALAGLLSHGTWIVSKNLATPTWAFFCLAVFLVLIGVLHWVADVKGFTRWAKPIAPAGIAALTCYMIPYIWSAVQQLLGLHWPGVLSYGFPGLLKAFAYAFLVVGLTWCFTRLHLKLRI